MAGRGGRLSAGAGGEPAINLQITLDGFERASEELKAARRDANMRIRGAIERAAQQTVLPHIQDDFPKLLGEDARGLDVGAMADSLFVKRDRSAVLIGSRLRGALNRALGWIDFGGKRPLDSMRRTGPHVIVKSLDRDRASIDEAILGELLRSFGDLMVR